MNKGNIQGLLKEKIVCNKKTVLGALISIVCLMLGLKVLPREVSILQRPIIFLLAFVVLVDLSLAIRIKISEKGQKIFSVFLLLITPMICVVNVEYIIGNNLQNLIPKFFVLNYCIYLAVFLILQLILNHTRWTIILGSSIFYVFAIVDAFIWMFRGIPLRAADVYAIKTAGNVANGYKIVLSEKMIVGLLVFIVLILIAFRCTYKEPVLKKRIIKGNIVLLYVIILIGIVFNKNNLLKLGVNPEGWNVVENHQKQGGVLNFFAGFSFMKIEMPNGYSSKKVTRFLEKYATDDKDAHFG